MYGSARKRTPTPIRAQTQNAEMPKASVSSASSALGVRPLPRAFFERDPITVARALLGKMLVRTSGRATLAGRIVETEAYLGADDAAAHSAAGRTERNAVLFG